MQEERFEVFFQNISGLYRAVQRLRTGVDVPDGGSPE